MSSLAEERFKACEGHPERQQIFYLEKMLIEAGHPYWFNFWEDLRPTPFNQTGGDPEKDIDWGSYEFGIEIGLDKATGTPDIVVEFNSEGDKTLLELIDLQAQEDKKERPFPGAGAIHRGLTAEQAMEIIEEYFKGRK